MRRSLMAVLAATTLLLSACAEKELYGDLSEREANEMVAVLQNAGVSAAKSTKDGKVWTLKTRPEQFSSAVAVRPDGRIDVRGGAATVRLMPDGTLDTTFNGTGTRADDVTPTYGFRGAMALQADGKIVVGSTSAGLFTVSRYHTDGSPDVTFGTNGIAQPDFATPDEDPFDSLTSLAIQPDGRIVAAGVTWNAFTTGDGNFALARLDANASTLPLPLPR